jgi:dTDP-4-amino-4,6-dideoxygalactose transaminase
MNEPILLSPPDVGPDERQFLLDALDSNWVAPAGPDLDAFEQDVAQVVGRRYGVALSSGTAALHLALEVLGVRAGDEVLVPTFTFAATANAVHYLGAEPVFLDSTPDTWAIDPDLVAEELAEAHRRGRRVGAVVPMDVYGQCADYDAIRAACEPWGVPVVSDAAEALGSTYRGRPAGSFGQLAALSFNGNKIITTGGGGMLVTDDAAQAARARYLSAQAREPAIHYEHRAIGYNYRLSNLLAAVGRAQLRSLDARVARRRAIYAAYRDSLAGSPGLTMMPMAPYGRSNCWLSCVVVDADEFGTDPPAVLDHLNRQGIEARPTWKPMHLQPVHRGRRRVGGAISEDLFARGICLPSGSGLRDGQLDRVVDAVLSTPRTARISA